MKKSLTLSTSVRYLSGLMPPDATWVIAGARSGSGRSDGDDRGDDHVDGDHVDRALWRTGELLQQATGVGDDHRLGHAEPADPSRPRLGPRRLDDRRAHDADRHVALRFGQRLLAERLRERVGVGPADRCRPRAAGRDELILHPSRRGAARSSRRARARRRRRARGGRRWRNWSSWAGWRLSASVSPLRRRAAATSAFHDRPMSNGPSLTSCSGAFPRRLPAT